MTVAPFTALPPPAGPVLLLALHGFIGDPDCDEGLGASLLSSGGEGSVTRNPRADARIMPPACSDSRVSRVLSVCLGLSTDDGRAEAGAPALAEYNEANSCDDIDPRDSSAALAVRDCSDPSLPKSSPRGSIAALAARATDPSLPKSNCSISESSLTCTCCRERAFAASLSLPAKCTERC